MNKQVSLSVRIERFVEAHLSHIALVPLLLHALCPLIVLGVSIANSLVAYYDKFIYHFVVTTLAYPIGAYVATIVLACAIWLVAKRKLKLHRGLLVTLALFAVLLVLATVSTAINASSNPYAFSGVAPSLVGIGSYFLFVLVYFCCGALQRDERPKRLFANLMVAESVPIGMHALWCSFTYRSVAPDLGITGLPEGIFYHFNHYGYFLTMVIVLSAALFVDARQPLARAAYLAIFVFNCVTLVFNNTLGAWVASFAGLLCLTVAYWVIRGTVCKETLLELALFVAILLVVSVWDRRLFTSVAGLLPDFVRVASGSKDADKAGTTRWHLWRVSARYIAERPLLGWGAEGFTEQLYRECGSTRAHNELVMYASFFGIPAAITYVAGCANVFVDGIRNRVRLDGITIACLSAAFAYLVSSLFGNMYFYTTPFFFALLGMSFVCETTKSV